ncbi:MAG: glycosyltransferase [Candidatus Palauibacterales bacterium]|nr:glycosyltransferase [Candidatus Palauibacterales bacterium]
MGPSRPRPGLGSRLSYNVRLPCRLDPGRHDLVVGFDFDGCFLPRPEDPPFVVGLKGIAADEQRFETGLPKARLRAQAGLEAVNVARADGVVVTSRYSAGWARRAYGAPPERTAVVPEGIDPGRWGLNGRGTESEGDARRSRSGRRRRHGR